MMKPYKQVDEGWAWVCLVACLIANMLNHILTFGCSVILIALLNKYQESVALTAMVGSVFTGTMCFSGIIVHILQF